MIMQTGPKRCTRYCVLAAFATIPAARPTALDRASAAEKPGRPNVLLITADDLNRDSLGVTGCKIPGITPNLDNLAAEGMPFLHGHVTIAVCQPCREVLMKEQYPSGNGILVRDVADHAIHRPPAVEAA